MATTEQPGAELPLQQYDNVVIRFAGDSGDGMQITGNQFTQTSAMVALGQWVLDGADGVDRKVVATLFEPTAANPGYGLSWWLIRPGLIGPSPRASVCANSGVSSGAVTKSPASPSLVAPAA